MAIRFRHEECARSLLRSGADPNHSSDDWPLLTEAAYVDTVSDPPTASSACWSGREQAPGRPPIDPLAPDADFVGPTTADLDATEAIWKFFAEHADGP